MSPFVGPIAVLICLGFVFAIMFGGGSFNGRRAATRVRRASGPNLGSMIAVIGIAGLLLDTASLPAVSRFGGSAEILVLVAVVLIIGTAITGKLTSVVVGMLGLVVAGLTLGVTGTVSLLILIALMLWILGAVRGFSR
jgi:hypothetical protein